MKWRVSICLFLAIAGEIIGGAFFSSSISTTTVARHLGIVTLSSSRITAIINPALFIGSILLFFIASIVELLLWIGILLKMAQLRQWTWFIGVLLIWHVGILVYSFAGPDAAPLHASCEEEILPSDGYLNPLLSERRGGRKR